MKNIISNIRVLFIVLTSFAVVFDFYLIYAGSFLLVFIMSMFYFNNKLPTIVILKFLVILCYLCVFVFNSSELFLPQPSITIAKYIFITIFSFSIIAFLDKSESELYLKSICWAMLLLGTIVVSYSYFLSITTSGYYGYGRLFNPIHGVETLSPKIAMTLISPCIVLYFFIGKETGRYLILLIFLLILITFIQSRMAILLGLVLLFLTLTNLFIKLKTLKKVTFIFSALILLFTLIGVKAYEVSSSQMDRSQANSRVLESGLKSKRFEHWSDGISKAIEYPFGGFHVDQNIEQVNYFHNIILDSARVSGLFSVMLILILFSLQFYMAMKTKVGSRSRALVAIFLLTLVMMQDVIIEGNFIVFLVSVVFSTICFRFYRGN